MRGSEARCADASQRGRLECLMEAYQREDESALGQLVNELSPALMRFFQGPTVTRPQAEDLLQELWLRVHRVRHTYLPGRPLLPWASRCICCQGAEELAAQSSQGSRSVWGDWPDVFFGGIQ